MLTALQILGLLGLTVVDLLLVLFGVRQWYAFRAELDTRRKASEQADLRVIESVAQLFEEAG